MSKLEGELDEQALPWGEGQLSPRVAFFRNAALCHWQQLREGIVKNSTETIFPLALSK